MEQRTIDPITRERIFGLYAGQGIMTSDSFNDGGSDHFEKVNLSLAKYLGMFLKVIPLWKLTEEDVKTAAMKCFPITHYFDEPEDSVEIRVTLNIQEEAHFSITESGRTSQFAINYQTGGIRHLVWESPMLPVPHYLDYFDFLRSKGYALPALGFSVQELYEQNVFWWPEELEIQKEIRHNGLVEHI